MATRDAAVLLVLASALAGAGAEAADPPPVRFGSAVAPAGDVNGDGVPDILAAGYAQANARGYPSGGRGKVFSGKDGALLFSLPVVPGDPQAMAPDFGEGAPSAANAGDLNGDGRPDLLLGVPLASPGGLRYAGQVLACSGRDGKVLFTLDGKGAGAQLGFSVAGGTDLDGDEIPDVLVGAPGAKALSAGGAAADREGEGRVQVFSGKDGKPLLSIDGSGPGSTFGSAVAFAGDVDGDGGPDVAVGAPEAGDAGVVGFFSGKDGKFLAGIKGTPNPMPRADVPGSPDDPPGPPMFGWTLAAVGDLDRDGKPDLAVGAIYAMPSGGLTEGRVQVVSGKDRSVLRNLDPPAAVEPGLCGYAVAAVGDVDGDGVPDVAAGLPYSGPGKEGRVLVFSGKDGRVLLAMRPATGGTRFGASVAAAGDVDRDGVPDVAVGQPGWPHDVPGPGRAFVMSGKDGSLLRILDGAKR